MAKQLDRPGEEAKGTEQMRRAATQAQAAMEQVTRATDEAGQAAQRAAEQAERSMRDAQERVQEGTRELAALGERAFEAWMRNNNQLLRQMMEMNVELVSWSREQLDESVEAMRSVAQARSIDDTVGVQARLMRTSVEHSVRHAGNVFTLATRAMIPAMQIASLAASSAERKAHSQTR